MGASSGVHPRVPSGHDGCAQVPGDPLVRFELSRLDLSRSERLIYRLFEESRARWRALETDPGSQILFRQEGTDHFRSVVWVNPSRLTSAIDVRRRSPEAMISHGHQLRGDEVNCAIHRYRVSGEGTSGQLRERVELRSTSRVATFYRKRTERDAIRAAEARLDELLREFRGA